MRTYTLEFRPGDTGLTPTFIRYQKLSDGTAVAPAPTITEIGDGLYKFSATPAEEIVFVVDGGATITDPTVRYMRGVIAPEDAYLDTPLSSLASAVLLTNTAQSLTANINTRAASAEVDTLSSSLDSKASALSTQIATGFTAVDGDLTSLASQVSGVPNQLLGSLLPDPVQPGTVAEFLAKMGNIFEIQVGSWKLDPQTNRLVLYAPPPNDNLILFQFNLLNAAGQPAISGVTERRRI